MIEPNTEIKIEYTETGALHMSMWRRGNAVPGGLRRFEDLPYDLEAAFRGAIHSHITKGANDDRDAGSSENTPGTGSE